MKAPRKTLSAEVQEEIRTTIPGVLPAALEQGEVQT
jgi:hypothetical protein